MRKIFCDIIFIEKINYWGLLQKLIVFTSTSTSLGTLLYHGIVELRIIRTVPAIENVSTNTVAGSGAKKLEQQFENPVVVLKND